MSSYTNLTFVGLSRAGLGLRAACNLLCAATLFATACADESAGAAGVGEVDVLAQETGTFPRSDETVNVNRAGPYKFEKFTPAANRTYGSAVMYYPTDAKPPFAAVAFSPGFTATKEQYEKFLGPLLASHGIAILLTSPTSTSDFPAQRAEDLKAALETIKAENARSGSPVQGKIATDRLCITGHSMGGGGTMIAANSLGKQIKCAVPLQPWQPGSTYPKVAVPIMFISAQNDTIAGNSSNSQVFYRSIPAGVPKYYVEFAGATHFLTSNDLGTHYDGQSKYMIAFYKTYLEDDQRYLEVLNAPKGSELSRYEKSN